MTSDPHAPGAPAIYLYRQVDRKDSGRANTEYNYVRIKILTEEGREKANVEIPYLSDRTGISNVRARTVHPDGSIVNFGGKVYDKMVEKTKGTKIKAKVFTVPDVQVGSIVEYHFNYDFEDGYVFNSYWVVSDDLYTRKAVFSLVPYKEFPVRWEWPAGLPAGTEPPKTGSDSVVRMTAKEIPAFQKEDFMPPENELKFRVIFIYNFDAETRITHIHGWCIPAQGRDFEVKDKEVTETGLLGLEAGELYSDHRTKIMEIPAPDPGNIIGYEVEHEDRPYVMQDEWFFQTTMPVADARYTLQLPPGWEYKAVWVNHSEVAPAAAGNNQWQWELRTFQK